jgi:hypothetical protein
VPKYFPTRAGIVVSTTDPRIKGARFPQDAGLFLISPADGSAQKLMNGVVDQIAVAPDGCAIAFIHLERPLELDSATLKVMRLCT